MSDQPTKPAAPIPLPNTADPTLILPSVKTTRENAGSYTKGKRKTIKGDPKYAANGKRIDAELYEAIWEAWRDGTRNKTRLSALYKLSWQSIHRLVETGYPERGFPSFLERLRVWEAAAATAKTSTIEDKKKKAEEDWEASKAEHLKLSSATRYGLAQLIRKAVEATHKVEFVRTRKRKYVDAQGAVHMVDEEVPISAVTMAETWRTIVNSVEAVGRVESFWRGGPTSRSEIMGSAVGALQAFQKLSPEQLDYIITSGGALPPGVTHEDLFGTLPADPTGSKN